MKIKKIKNDEIKINVLSPNLEEKSGVLLRKDLDEKYIILDNFGNVTTKVGEGKLSVGDNFYKVNEMERFLQSKEEKMKPLILQSIVLQSKLNDVEEILEIDTIIEDGNVIEDNNVVEDDNVAEDIIEVSNKTDSLDNNLTIDRDYYF